MIALIRMPLYFTIFLLVVGALLISEAGAAKAPLSVEIDKGRLVRLSQPAQTLFVANPEIADIQVVSPTMVYIFGRKVGETTLFAIDANETVLVNRRVMVTFNISALKTVLDSSLPNNTITVVSMEQGILLNGQVRTPMDALAATQIAESFLRDEDTKVVNQIGISGPTQVYLQVRIIEVSRNVKKQLGINWDAIGQFGSLALGVGVGTPLSTIAIGAVSGLIRGDNSAAALNYSNGNISVNGMIDAMADEGMITVLAEPNLTAMSGETAHFLAGGEFPIPVSRRDNELVVTYKEFGVSLSFTPTLTGEGTINLAVNPEVSQLSSVGAVTLDSLQIPALTTRRAQTTVELASGQSFAIAGLLQNNVNQDLSKFPFLGDLPVLGTLFRSTKFQRGESELVIIVTPYLVRAIDARKMATPVDGLNVPSDYQRIIEGRLTHKDPETQPLASPTVRSETTTKAAGFIYK